MYRYPNCLHILTLLKEKRFRDEISRADVAKLFMDDFYMRWLNAGNLGPAQADVNAATEGAGAGHGAQAGAGAEDVKPPQPQQAKT